MSDFTVNQIAAPTFSDYIQHGAIAVDGVTGATPLAAIKAGGTVDLLKMFLGNIGGTIGETSAIAILIGAAYLVFRKVISLRIPLTYIITLAVFVLIFGKNGLDMNYLLGHVLGGGLLLGAFFMATDYVTSPITPVGQIVFGICLGLFTGLFRLQGTMAEGVSYAIIFCNLLVPLIEKATRQKSFGKERVVSEK
jgi:electron transport complex protein RnfD